MRFQSLTHANHIQSCCTITAETVSICCSCLYQGIPLIDGRILCKSQGPVFPAEQCSRYHKADVFTAQINSQIYGIKCKNCVNFICINPGIKSKKTAHNKKNSLRGICGKSFRMITNPETVPQDAALCGQVSM